ncbi:hypothetical protein FJ959_22125 [Mesorhizobium sp. B2-2-4]|uniref:hypothetical protein n=1 Tax=unclassified Mesorhizobium TaxID=325217 RepID=UPI00112D0B1F|nr:MULTISPECIES: hypothetical protein [unclassified Mesorhizobium]TPM53232.1 hypothetical protein FJ959_22125 [Mesorhizobium sp. B2-2-4]TPM62126.1 hypothetical protein FJ965_21245 [Mesorhizobium sp. B2-2-1]TPN68497.1 hypothetical protein FJ984_11725 [Mesorhizobium sp. B1-1-3]
MNVTEIRALIERLDSHMGKADMGEVLRDCRLAAKTLEAALSASPVGQIAEPVAWAKREHLEMGRHQFSTVRSPTPGFDVPLYLSPTSVGQIAEGWRIVPVEPTEAMINAGVSEAHGKTWGDIVANCHRAMLSAAPAPPATGWQDIPEPRP